MHQRSQFDISRLFLLLFLAFSAVVAIGAEPAFLAAEGEFDLATAIEAELADSSEKLDSERLDDVPPVVLMSVAADWAVPNNADTTDPMTGEVFALPSNYSYSSGPRSPPILG